MDFKPCFKVYNFVSVYPKSIKLGQMTTLNVIFHVVVSIYRLVKIWNLPQFAAQFWNGQLGVKGKQIRKVLFAIGQGKKTHWARKVYTGKNAAYGFLRVQGTALRFGNKAKKVWITICRKHVEMKIVFGDCMKFWKAVLKCKWTLYWY